MQLPLIEGNAAEHEFNLTASAIPILQHAKLYRAGPRAVVAVFPGADSLGEFGGELILARAASAQPIRDITVALSGGQTPERKFAWLGRQQVPAHLKFFFVDERYVPITAGDSNFRKAAELFFKPAGIAEKNIFRFPTELPADEAGAAYESVLRKQFSNAAPDQIPRFDLMFLGMGDDGHTASLFPGSSSIHETKRLSLVTTNPHNLQKRLTLTLPVLNHAREVVVMAQGTKKAAMIQHTFQSRESRVRSDSERLPIDYVAPDDGVLLWALDKEAAAWIV